MDPRLVAALTLCRALHDGAAMLLFGTSLFAGLLMPPGLRGVARRQVYRIAGFALPLIVATALLRIPLASVGMGDGWWDGLRPTTIRDVMVDTEFGRTWSIHLAAVACLAPFCFAGQGGSLVGVALASGFAVATLALSGHAAAGAGAGGWLSECAVALHLLAAGAWIGGLVMVRTLLPLLGVAEARHDAALALRRFSLAGHGFVAVTIIAGIITALLVAGLPGDASPSPYVVVLSVKIALVGGMTGLALLNRYRWVPQLREHPGAARRSLVRNTRTALLLGSGALAAAGLLGLLDPP